MPGASRCRMPPLPAISACNWSPGSPQPRIQGMIDLGYRVTGGDVGSVQAVLIDQQTGKQYGGADNRREGTVIGLPQSF